MDLDFTPAEDAFREEVRQFLAENAPRGAAPSLGTRDGFESHREWERVLADARLSVVSWPTALGGRDASLTEWVIFEEEYYAAGAPPRVNQNGINLLAPTIFAHGTQEQVSRILPAMARGDVIWAQAWSEPEAGSDLASIKARASRTEGGWLLTGQKTWSTRAAFADRGFGLFRTGPAGERHRGLTYFMFDLRRSGVTVRGISDLSGEPAFAEIFLDDVFVPDKDVLGEVGSGWRVAMSTAANERGLTLRSPGRFTATARRLLALADQCDDSSMDDRVVDAWIGARAYELHTWATVTHLMAGGHLGAEASIGKVHWSELDARLHEAALDLAGPQGERMTDWTRGYIFALAGRYTPEPMKFSATLSPNAFWACLGEDRMRFQPSEEQVAFAHVLGELLDSADVLSVARSWSAGQTQPGRELWQALGGLGVLGLAVAEEHGGVEATRVDLVLAFEELGRSAAPGPFVESVAVVPALLAGTPREDRLESMASGKTLATIAMPPHVPYAVDAHAVDDVYLLEGSVLALASISAQYRSLDASRGLALVQPTDRIAGVPDHDALNLGSLATAAQILGAGRSLLQRATQYAKDRHQFGVPIGSFQAVKHKLADVAIALEMARPLLLGAALAPSATADRDVSAAKVACTDAAQLAARVALQVHGAMGYTAEHDLSLWLTKVRALVSAWGTTAFHRQRIRLSLRGPQPGALESLDR